LNSISILEAFDTVESISGKAMSWSYDETNREGDHICYYSDLRKMRSHYPAWSVTIDLDSILEQIVRSWSERLSGKPST
jgi:CDP-paratose 2-epimerase